MLYFAANDGDALQEIYSSTGGDAWTKRHGWQEADISKRHGVPVNALRRIGRAWGRKDWWGETDISEWHGVTVNAAGCVTCLRLVKNNLTGEVLLLTLWPYKSTGTCAFILFPLRSFQQTC